MLAKSYSSEEPDEKVVFLNLYKSLYQDLYRYGYRLSKDKDITKDAIQQMFFELWSKEDRFKSVERIKPYLIKYLHRKILKEISVRNASSSTNAQFFQKTEESYESILIKNQSEEELSNSIKAALKCLTKRQKEIIELRFMNGHTFSEIGEMLGLQHRTLYNLLHGGIKTLREKVKIKDIV
ncbi:MAG TPA: sigma-70 family RNA polymerase sigma factor [Cyclobacteriaceae bacterium]|nr:sigma-70 family RNA polymerase sigma factor [Cyclobacteriaceae bacterium]